MYRKVAKVLTPENSCVPIAQLPIMLTSCTSQQAPLSPPRKRCGYVRDHELISSFGVNFPITAAFYSDKSHTHPSTENRIMTPPHAPITQIQQTTLSRATLKS